MHYNDSGVYVLRGICPKGDMCLGAKCPGGKCPGGICPWGKYPGGIWPGWVLSCHLNGD